MTKSKAFPGSNLYTVSQNALPTGQQYSLIRLARGE